MTAIEALKSNLAIPMNQRHSVESTLRRNRLTILHESIRSEIATPDDKLDAIPCPMNMDNTATVDSGEYQGEPEAKGEDGAIVTHEGAEHGVETPATDPAE